MTTGQAELSDEDLLQRVGEMAYAQQFPAEASAVQMLASEGLMLDEASKREADALAAELARRGLAA